MERSGVVAGKFYSEFFTQLFEYFCADLRLHGAYHSHLGIIGKIFSSCRRQKSSIGDANLVKSDDVRRERKAKVRHGRLRAAQASMG